MTGCEVPKILPYKTLISFIRGIDIGEVLSLESLAATFGVEAFSGVYRPLKAIPGKASISVLAYW